MGTIPKWLKLAVLTVTSLAIVLASLATAKAKISKGIVITIGANGEPRFYGLSLASTRVRGFVFGGLAHLGTNVSVSVTAPPSSVLTNRAAMTNWIATLEAIKSTGLLKPSGPVRSSGRSQLLL